MIKSLGHCHIGVCFRLEDIRSLNIKKWLDCMWLTGVVLIKHKHSVQLPPLWWYKDQGHKQSDTGHLTERT